MKLPRFTPTASQKQWVKQERRTAAFIRAFWTAASPGRRKDPEFLWFLTASGWTNVHADGAGYESTREWRNNILASYLGVHHWTLESLVDAVRDAFPAFKPLQAQRLLATHTGITHHYTAIRPRTRKYLLRHASELSEMFGTVSSAKPDPEGKIAKVAAQLAKMPHISTPRGGWTPPFNPFTPVLACLDPRRRFPIMNQRTHRLLRAIGKDHDRDGAIALYHLIGSRGIRDSFDLDVYSQAAEAKFTPAPRIPKADPAPPRVVPIKSELESLARLVARRVRIRKEHNKLTNRFRRAVFANVRPQEANFDLLIEGWRGKRRLLIEAKTDWKGPTGRTQVRQAIGQLFDYRMSYFAAHTKSVDLAILLPSEPSDDVKKLLRSLRIHVIWFSGDKLCGTLQLQ